VIEKRIAEIKRLADADRLDEASAAVQAFVAEFPGQAEAWRYRAYVLALRGQHRDAVKDMTSAIGLNSREPHYYWTRGKYLLDLGDNEAAIKDLTETLRLCDEHSSDYYREAAHLLRAEAYLRLGRPEEARRDCESVSDNATIWAGSIRSKEAILADCK
jgi:tetratricopeptide (TPR) repeat protein